VGELAISQLEPDSIPRVPGLLRGQRRLQFHHYDHFFQQFAGSDGLHPLPWHLRNICFPQVNKVRRTMSDRRNFKKRSEIEAIFRVTYVKAISRALALRKASRACRNPKYPRLHLTFFLIFPQGMACSETAAQAEGFARGQEIAAQNDFMTVTIEVLSVYRDHSCCLWNVYCITFVKTRLPRGKIAMLFQSAYPRKTKSDRKTTRIIYLTQSIWLLVCDITSHVCCMISVFFFFFN
jgi:hypothetical protein